VFLFKQHLKTKKHKKNTENATSNKFDNSIKKGINVNNSNGVAIYCKCGKHYKHKSSYYRHLKNCICKNNTCDDIIDIKIPDTEKNPDYISDNTGDDIGPDTIKIILKNILHENIKLRNDIKNIKNVSITNNNINISVFLNDKCKNAMNLTDFIDNMKMSIEDLEYSGKHGYVKGVSQILMRNLINIEPYQRPVHCSDLKRLKFYVKDNDIWERDINNKKIDNSINYVSKKQHGILKKWESQNPNYENCQEKLQQYFNMVKSLINGCDIDEMHHNKSKIMRNMSNKINIKNIINM